MAKTATAPALEPVNPALAFEPVTTDTAIELSTPELFGFKVDDEETRGRITEMIRVAYDDYGTLAEGVSYISKVAATPQELVCASIMFLNFIDHLHKRADRREAIIEAIAKGLARHASGNHSGAIILGL